MPRYKKIEGGQKLQKFIKPMLAQLTDAPAFDDPGWIFEIKWDGYRAVAEVLKSGTKLYSRNGLSFSAAYRKVFDALTRLKRHMILDGEIVVIGEDGHPDFQKLQNYSNTQQHTIHYFVFDILQLDDRDLRSLPLLERKALLRAAISDGDVIRYCDHVEEEGKAFFSEIKKNGLEGMIAKRSDSTYSLGKRTRDWLKIKNVKSEEAVIIGFTPPKGARAGFGSLLLGQYEKGKLTYVGNVGTGFNEETLRSLHGQLKRLETPASPLTAKTKVPAGTKWTTPELVCNIKYTEKTSAGIVRHPVFLGLRLDKKPSEVHPEKALAKPKAKAIRRKKG